MGIKGLAEGHATVALFIVFWNMMKQPYWNSKKEFVMCNTMECYLVWLAALGYLHIEILQVWIAQVQILMLSLVVNLSRHVLFESKRHLKHVVRSCQKVCRVGGANLGFFTKFLVGGLAFGDDFQSPSWTESDRGDLALWTESDEGGLGNIVHWSQKCPPYSKIRAHFGVLSIK